MPDDNHIRKSDLRSPRKLFKLRLAVIFCVLTCIAATACDLSGVVAKKEVIRLHEDQIDVLQINNAIAGFLIEKGYGYDVERVECTTKEMQRLIVEGGIDVSLEVWRSNNQDWYRRETGKGSIVDLGPIYDKGHQFWVIPAWVAEAYHIRTVADMRRHWQLFQDPEDSSKGIFFNCITGWTCLEINSIKLEAYGLDKYYNAVSPISPEALRATFENAQLKRVPVFGYYWSPNALMAAYDWQILEEPEYSEACWENVVAATENRSERPIGQACGYEHTAVYKLAHQGLEGAAPDVMRMLRMMVIGTEALDVTLAWAIEHGGQQWDAVAIHFLRRYPDHWHGWVSQQALDKINAALAAVEAP